MAQMLITPVITKSSDGPNERLETVTFAIYDELPADALGEYLSDVIQDHWRDGHDPTHIRWEIRFR